MDNRRLFLAALLSLAVLFLWQWIFPPEKPQPSPPVEESAPGLVDGAIEGGVTRGVPDEVAPAASEGDATAAAVSGLDAEDQPTPEAVVIRAEIEEEFVLETEDAIARFTNRGAQLVSYELKEHPDSEGGRVDLVRRRQQGPYPFGLVGADGEPHTLNEALFVVDRSESQGLSFAYSGPEGTGRKEFDLSESGMMEVVIEAGGEAFGVVLGPGVRNPSEAEQENRFSTKTAIYKRAGEVELLAAASVKERTIVSGDAVEWVGLQDNYFLSGWVTGSPLAEIIVQPYLEQPGSEGSRFHPLLPGQELTGEEKDLPRELTCTLQPRGLVLEGSVYFGAKQYDRLKALGDPRTGQPYGLEEAVALGFFGFFSKILLVGLQWIHGNIIGNYGWAIILLTVLIRIILFPLTHKSFVSMQKMQELNPKIQAIRQKYRSKLKDKQGRPNAEAQRKMNEEVMGLYKKEGVNPAGGCLPMLLQLPVLFAFYRLLSAAVELRHAPWLGWIQDLSAPDPFYILPLVMGASQFIQQKMTPSTADPMQRRIFMLMPVFFTVLFLGFPSGLVLYWLTNNVLGIAQQGVYRRMRQRTAEAK